MIAKVIDGIIAAIRSEYDSKAYRIYTEFVEQGLKEPCFSIMCLKPEAQRKGKGRTRRFYSFDIVYFPKSDCEPVQECTEVYENLVECLMDITVDGRILHGSDISGTVVEGILHVQVTYDLFLLKQAEEQNMEAITNSHEVT